MTKMPSEFSSEFPERIRFSANYTYAVRTAVGTTITITPGPTKRTIGKETAGGIYSAQPNAGRVCPFFSLTARAAQPAE